MEIIGTVALGIALILSPQFEMVAASMDRNIAQELTDVENKQNLFHISLYQGQFKDVDVKALTHELAALGKSAQPFRVDLDSALKRVGPNIFWNARKNAVLQTLHEAAVKTFSKYRRGVMAQFQDEYATLSAAQKQEVDQHGVTNVMQNFNPHITLYYSIPKNKSTEDILKKLRPDAEHLGFTARYLSLGELGYDGNVMRWIEIVPLGN